MARASILFFCVVLCVAVQSRKLPNYVKSCKRDGPNVSRCTKETLNSIRPYLRNGIPELDVPPFQAFPIPDVVLGGDGDAYRIAFTNVNVNVADYYVTKLKVDFNTLVLRATVKFPTATLSGIYDVNLPPGVIAVPIQEKGDFQVTGTNIAVEVIIHGNLRTAADGKEDFTLTNVDINADFGDIGLKLGGVDGFQDPTIRDLISATVNENKNLFIGITKPFLEKLASAVVLEYGNRILTDVPLDDVFPRKQ